MKKILVPIDFSVSTSTVLDYIKNNLSVSEVHLINVVADPGYVSFEDLPVIMPTGWLDEVKKTASNKLDSLKKVFNSDLKVYTEVKTTVNSVHEVILNYAKDNQLDLIVIGTHGRNMLERFMLGSVAEKLLRSSSIPILAVPPK